MPTDKRCHQRKDEPPSATQLDALRHMASSPDGRLIGLRGGFWTTRDTPTKTVRRPDRDGDYVQPTWSVITLTMRALERKGWIVRANVWPEAWRDERVLTDAGRALLNDGMTLDGLPR